MGDIKDNSLKITLRNTYLKILFFSFIFTLITFIIWGLLFSYYKRPANYYELKIPRILEELSSINDLLDSKNEEKLDLIIPKKGIKYEIIDIDGNSLYGNIDEKIIENKRQLYKNLNKNIFLKKNKIGYIYPILDEKAELEGALVLEYSLSPSSKIDSKLFDLFSNILLFFPFIYIFILTLYYSRKLSNELNKPIEMLMKASENISNENLDFTISYVGNNELGRLSQAFENMRINLKDSLEKQWRLEEKRKENFAAIAHDLKTPLTIVKTYSENLLNKDLDEKTKRYVETISRNNERAIVLIENINKISSIESEEFILKPEKFDVLNYCLDKKEEIINMESDLDIDVNIVDNRNLIYGNYDILRLNQVIDNIFSNALRYSDDFILINIILEDSNLETSIINSSKNISKTDLVNAFEKFYKGDKSRSFESGHSGLGLYISKEIVEAHGGNISIENIEDGVMVKFNIRSL